MSAAVSIRNSFTKGEESKSGKELNRISRNKNNRNQTKWAGLTVKQTQLERELSGLTASLVEIFQSTAESR